MTATSRKHKGFCNGGKCMVHRAAKGCAVQNFTMTGFWMVLHILAAAANNNYHKAQKIQIAGGY